MRVSTYQKLWVWDPLLISIWHRLLLRKRDSDIFRFLVVFVFFLIFLWIFFLFFNFYEAKNEWKIIKLIMIFAGVQARRRRREKEYQRFVSMIYDVPQINYFPLWWWWYVFVALWVESTVLQQKSTFFVFLVFVVCFLWWLFCCCLKSFNA